MNDLYKLHIQISVQDYECERKRELDVLPDYTTYCLGFTDNTGITDTLDKLSDQVKHLCEVYRTTSELPADTPLHVGLWFTTPANKEDVTFEPWNKEPNPNWTPTIIQGGKSEK